MKEESITKAQIQQEARSSEKQEVAAELDKLYKKYPQYIKWMMPFIDNLRIFMSMNQHLQTMPQILEAFMNSENNVPADSDYFEEAGVPLYQLLFEKMHNPNKKEKKDDFDHLCYLAILKINLELI